MKSVACLLLSLPLILGDYLYLQQGYPYPLGPQRLAIEPEDYALKVSSAPAAGQTRNLNILGGDPSSWSPFPITIPGSDPSSWSPFPITIPGSDSSSWSPYPITIPGSDPSSWSPYPITIPGSDPSSWSPYPISIPGSDSSSWSPFPLTNKGEDPATWGPYPQTIPGSDPSSWSPFPLTNKGEDPATWSPSLNIQGRISIPGGDKASRGPQRIPLVNRVGVPTPNRSCNCAATREFNPTCATIGGQRRDFSNPSVADCAARCEGKPITQSTPGRCDGSDGRIQIIHPILD